MENQARDFGDYEIDRVVGEGGFSVVCLAHPRNLPNIKVAIKRPINPDDKSQVSRLWLEAEALNALAGNPNIVGVRNYHANDNIPSLVLEYCDSSLEGKLNESRDRKLPWREAVEITGQILEGLRAVHAHPNVGYHADLKPSNVLLQNNNGREVVKLADFGAQTGQRMPTQSIAHLGSIVEKGEATAMTFAYHTPEQLCGETVTSATDIHQIGQLLYEMISGNNFRRTEGRELPSKHNAPKWLDEFVFKMTDPSQTGRPNVKQALEYLQQGLDGKFDGPGFFKRIASPFVTAGRKIDSALERVVNFGKKTIKYAPLILGGCLIAGSWIKEEIEEDKTLNMASEVLNNSNDSLVFVEGINYPSIKIGIAPLNRILSNEKEVSYIDTPMGIGRIVGISRGKLIYTSPYEECIFATDLRTGNSERIFDLYGKHNRNYIGFTFDEVGLTQETNGNSSDVVVKSKGQWFKLINGSLEKTTEPVLLQLQHSYNVPDSNLKFERDFFPYDGIYLARQDSGWGDR